MHSSKLTVFSNRHLFSLFPLLGKYSVESTKIVTMKQYFLLILFCIVSPKLQNKCALLNHSFS